ncbi:MAG: ATP-binding protein [Alistipes sp.]
MLQLINDILDISKIEAGTLEFNFRTMDPGLLCQEQYEIHKTRVREGVRLVLDDHAGSVELIGDHNRLAQVYTNLIGNAIKFTHQGEIRFGYRVEGDRIVGYVSDTGVGIPADKVGAVFDRFIKLNDFAAGTGLGLSITKMIIEKMGGGIEVSSREGEGTTFRFTIPYSRPDTEGPGKAADGARRHAQRATEAVEGKRILVAEDIDSNFMLIDALIGRRFDLLRARNGEEAVALFGRERPDLVLMDLKMPVMDGYEATRLIRAEAPTAPLVVMSAFAYEGDIERAYEAGCTDYVTKPVSRKRLMEVIERYLG